MEGAGLSSENADEVLTAEKPEEIRPEEVLQQSNGWTLGRK
jgi:hypothetical protein